MRIGRGGAVFAVFVAAGLSGCGSGGGGGGPGAAAPTYTVGGAATGLSGTGLVLQLNGAGNLAVSANGTFTFTTQLASGATYAASVLAQPTNPGQTCTVSNGSGTVGNTNVANVGISCTTDTFTIGGTVSGLSGTGLVLQNNAGNNLAIAGNLPFTFSAPIASGASYAVTVLTQPTNPSQTCAVSSGSGTVGAGNVTNVSVSCTTNSFTIGGTVSGLSGTGLVLRNNGGNDLAIGASGSFNFSTPILSGAPYAVTVFAQPTGPTQTCTVTSGSGTVGAGNITSVNVSCATNSFTIGGTVSGLSGSGLVLRNNGGNNLAIAGNGGFTFSAPIASGATYAVTVLTQPTSPSQTCTVTSGSATVGAGNVANVDVSCITNTFTVGGTVSGHNGTGLTLKLNGTTNLAVAGNGAFAFGAIPDGSAYSVSVFVQPLGQTCAVTGGSGTLAGANVTTIAVSCIGPFTLGGTVSGLAGSGLVLQNNGGNNLAVGADGSFTFGASLAPGAAYAVTVLTQPTSPSQTCAVSNGSGTVGSANVVNVGVSCATDTFTIGVTVSGLSGTGLVLQNNGGNNLAIGASGAFTFGTPIASGAAYAVTVFTQPTNPSQTCTVTGGSGSVADANVAGIGVSCATNSFTVGGTASGLSGTGLVLQNNAGNDLAIAGSGFTFSAPIASGATYAVTVLTQPTNPSQTCTVTNGSGTVGSANVTNVSVSCATNSFTIGGTVNALVGTGLVLQNDAGNNLAIAVNGGFTFTTPILSGATYAVTVLTQPTGPAQTCTISNGSGTVGAGDVTNVRVGCGFSIGTVSDPLAGQQWHLKNTGQNAFADVAGVAGMDINVDPVYSTLGFTGAGVTVAVVDTGLEIAHEDLAANVVTGGSWNFINLTTDPTSTATNGDHGTSVSGLIAMARNTVGGIGVAPGARLKGFNFVSSDQMGTKFVDSLGASSANPNSSDAFIFNQSFGIETSNPVLIDPLEEAQYLSGVTSLRGGKGALYVKAAGNGFSGTCAIPALSCENANFDPGNTLPYQIVVGAVNADGIKASYSSAGSAIWVSAPGGEFGFNASVAPGYVAEAYEPAMITTDQTGPAAGYAASGFGFSAFDNCGAPNTSCNYTNGMNGTSSATPVTTGVVALLLEANPTLTWRDVKHILASTARQIDPAIAAVSITLVGGAYVAEPAWTTNAAGFHFHDWYGFGMVDASTAVNMARTYTPGQLGTFANTGLIASAALSIAIPDNSVTGATGTLTVPSGPPVQVIEAVQISVTATHPAIGDLGIELTSPSGTRSVLKNIGDGFGASANLNGMVLLSNAFYGENPAGIWSIKVVDGSGVNTTVGTLTGWSIRVYGH